MSGIGLFGSFRNHLGALNGDQSAQREAWRRFAAAAGGAYREEGGSRIFDSLDASHPDGPQLLSGTSCGDIYELGVAAAPA